MKSNFGRQNKRLASESRRQFHISHANPTKNSQTWWKPSWEKPSKTKVKSLPILRNIITEWQRIYAFMQLVYKLIAKGLCLEFYLYPIQRVWASFKWQRKFHVDRRSGGGRAKSSTIYNQSAIATLSPILQKERRSVDQTFCLCFTYWFSWKYSLNMAFTQTLSLIKTPKIPSYIPSTYHLILTEIEFILNQFWIKPKRWKKSIL